MSWKSKKVLVTGGAGFIGSNLAIRLHELGAEVEVIDNFSPFCGSNPFNLSPIEKRMRIHRMDMAKESLDPIVRDKEYIFHLAGQTGHTFSHQKPEVDLEINTVTALKLLEACRKSNPQAKIIYTNTRQIYGEPQYLPVDEKHPICPPDINAIHKVAAEEYFKLFYKVYGLKFVSLRLTNTYGPRQSIKTIQNGIVGWFLNRALLNETLTVASGQDQTRDFTFVDDVVQACLLCAFSEKTWGEIYNLSGSKATLKELAEMIIKVSGQGKLGEIEFSQEEKKIQLKDYYATSEKLKAAVGWEAESNLEAGLKKTLDYFRSNRQYYLNRE